MKKWPLRLAATLCLIPSGNLQAAPATFALFDASLFLQVQLAPEVSHSLERGLHDKLIPKRYGKDLKLEPLRVITDADINEAVRKSLQDSQPMLNCAIPREKRAAPSSCQDANR
jgi:hypothetical protein